MSLEGAPQGKFLQGLLWASAVLVFLAGIQLFVLADHTETLFAWTVHPPLTAAFLGALYWAAGVLEALAARSGNWGGARLAVPGVLVFTILTNWPTWTNLRQYHLESPVAWAWIATYLVVPVLYIWALFAQRHLGWALSPPSVRLPTPMRLFLGSSGIAFLAGGGALMLAPEQVGALWPWDLSPQVGSYTRFTEPYVGCWGLGLGVVSLQSAWEDDLQRLRPLWPAMIATGLLCTLSLLRYRDAITWLHPATEVLIAALAGVTAMGAWGEWLWRNHRAAG